MSRDPRYPEIMTVGELMSALASCDKSSLVLVCPEEPHTACHYAVGCLPVEPGDSAILITVEPGSPQHRRWMQDRGLRTADGWPESKSDAS